MLHRLRDEKSSPALYSILFAGPLSAKVSAYTDDITVFVSHCLDTKVVKKVVAKYKHITGVKINFDKSEGLWLHAERGGDSLPWPFCWSDGPIHIFGGMVQAQPPT